MCQHSGRGIRLGVSIAADKTLQMLASGLVGNLVKSIANSKREGGLAGMG